MRPTVTRFVAVLVGCALLVGGCGGEGEQPPPGPTPPSESTRTWPVDRLPPRTVLREWATPEDVRVQVLREGRGEAGAAGQAMEVHFHGFLRSGQSFLERVIPLDQPGGVSTPDLMPGLKAALKDLRPRERRRVFIPAAQAFGGEPPDPTVPRHADLFFEVTRLAFESRDLALGGGPEVKVGQRLLVHYRGTLEDGSVFDDSRVNNKGAPVSITLQRPTPKEAGVVEGWVRGVPGMRVGGRRLLEVPSHLGYGNQGSRNGKVPPHADLTFDIELVGLE